MKNKIAIASAFIAASSFSTAEIVINDFLSFEGFVDMSYSHTEVDNAGNVANASTSANSFQIDQVEISWLFDFDPVTAQIDVEYEDNSGNGNGGANGNTTAIEQAFATYHFDNGGAITAGRYASMLGFEAFEPTGLYQYSTAYSFFGNLAIFTPGYAQGVKYTQEGDNTFFGISVQDTGVTGVGANAIGGSATTGGYGVEAAAAYYMDNGLSFFLGGAYDDLDDLGDAYVINTYVTFETGAWIFAAELNYGEIDPNAVFIADTEGFTGLLMANFAYSDAASITARLSYYDQELSVPGASLDQDGYALTLAHGYAFTDNLFLVTEVSYAEEEVSVPGAAEQETLFGAIELLFTF